MRIVRAIWPFVTFLVHTLHYGDMVFLLLLHSGKPTLSDQRLRGTRGDIALLYLPLSWPCHPKPHCVPAHACLILIPPILVCR